jgi:hypothetical protein
MYMSRWLKWAATTAGVVVLATNVWAQKPIEKTESEQKAALVEQVALAAELAAFGRGELAEATGLKDFKSPEALVAAGGILLRVHKQTAGKVQAADAKVMDDQGNPVAEEANVHSFGDEAAMLFDEARAMASKDKAALENQIKQAELVPERGASGGPKVISRTVKSGKSQKVDIAFEPNSRAVVNMRGTGKVQFEVIGPAGKGSWGTYHWQTGKGSDRGITVKIINGGGPPVTYMITTN